MCGRYASFLPPEAIARLFRTTVARIIDLVRERIPRRFGLDPVRDCGAAIRMRIRRHMWTASLARHFLC